jgi:O-antigen/teichoic acid export membrane protein
MKGSTTFYSSLLILIILNVIIKPVWILAIDRQVQNAVGIEEYGVYFSLFNLSIIGSFLLDWGVTSYYNRQLAANEPGYAGFAGKFFSLKLQYSFLYTAVIILICYLAGIRNFSIIAGLVLLQVVTSFFLFFRAIITGNQLFRTDAWLSVMDKTLMILVCLGPLYFPLVFGTMTITRFLYLQVACTSLAMLVAVFILFRIDVTFKFRKKIIFPQQFAKEALPYGLIVLLMSLHYRADAFLLERLHPEGPSEAGIYASSYRLLDAANMIGFLFVSFLMPYVARLLAERKNPSAVILTTRHLLLITIIGLVCVVVFFAPWIHDRLYVHSDPYAVSVMQWAFPALIGYSLVHIYGSIMTASGYIRQFCMLTGIAVIMNLILNVILIPYFGAEGAAFAALATQTLCGIATMLFVRQKLSVPLHISSLLIYIFIAFALCFYFYWGSARGMSAGLLIISGAGIAIVLMLLTGLLKPLAWKQLFMKTPPRVQ